MINIYMNIREQYLKNVEQAKKRDHKIDITDIAISKVPKTSVYGFSDEQNKKIQDYHIEILSRSKNMNNSNEVAAVIRLDLPDKKNDIWLTGSVNEVKFNGTDAEYAIRFAPYRTIFIMHNHPSTLNFSYGDIMLFANNMSVYGITVVTNTGETHIMCKTDSFSFEVFIEFVNVVKEKTIESFKAIEDPAYKQKVVQEEIANHIIRYADRLGIYYERGGGTHGR